MNSSTSLSSSTPSPTTIHTDPLPQPSTDAPHGSPVVAFIIGLAIVILASILNAAGLNLTKLDHVRTSVIPREQRRRDWLRPLWLLGMVLYILSQVIGSTLALEYMRAEYVAPLGSTSLIFNFLFAKFLVDSPVTSYDIYGTIIVIIGVVGIVAFGSINSGLGTGTDAAYLTYLWTRSNWLLFFFFMAFSLILLYTFTSQLEQVLNSRSDINAEPFTGMGSRRPALAPSASVFKRIVSFCQGVMMWVREKLEIWTAPHEDKRIAWTLGIGWACCGGGLAGGCLVFAKAAVKLITGSLSHQNKGNQFGHASSIFTFLLLVVTSVAQIICLNRGLKVYDSTLVVPVFYGVYTATGFLNSLIFNDEVDAYQSWTLFLIFVAITILISGVVLLTYKKPEKKPAAPGGSDHMSLPTRSRRGTPRRTGDYNDDEQDVLRVAEEGEGDAEELWQIGDASDDEEHDQPHSPRPVRQRRGSARSRREGEEEGEEERMIGGDRDGEHRESTSSDATLARPERDDEFGEWEQGKGLH
ncbi:uncharacterized protein FIBRA_07203 [Fibroporia radiculosa]|uniref:Uncharacterized protein n=1 Tax=Fibroporia radiculosa TaxID=599839 RepID=J4H4H5_9APHY|nr:uncharacterized protein FIBRA_07203 [Fibroporia radiculosa]CCM05004.1 predicted protein [Fibroporia radiculosa]